MKQMVGSLLHDGRSMQAFCNPVCFVFAYFCVFLYLRSFLLDSWSIQGLHVDDVNDFGWVMGM